MAPRKKSDKELLFAAKYVANGRNGTNAAVSVGYAKKSAHVTASRLLKKPKVAAEIDRLTNKTAAKLEITGEKVLQEIATIGFMPKDKTTLGSKVRALELLAKHLKLLTEKHEFRLDDLSQLTDDQLMALIGRLSIGSASAAAGGG